MTRAAAPDAVDRVLLAASLIPPGRVASYGDLGRLAGVGPRQVGAIMREHGSSVPWWRVISASGEFAMLERARVHWDAEGIVVRPDGLGCRMRDHRVNLHDLAVDYALAALERGWPSPDWA